MQFIALLSVLAVTLTACTALPYQLHDNQPTFKNESLRALFVVHRHGERTLAATYAGDVLNDANLWPDGLGQLNLKGRRRMHRLGNFLKEHYPRVVDGNPKNVYVRSSGIDRCLDSAQMVAHAMYPPTGNWLWSSDETWQPIPIFTVYKPNDGMLNPGAYCPAASEEGERIMGGLYAQELNAKYESLLKKLSSNIGFPVKDLFTAKGVFDSIFTARVNQRSLPSWADEDTYEQLKQLYDSTFRLEFSTKRQQRFRTGVLLNELYERLMSLVTIPESNKPWTGIRWDAVDDRHKKTFVYSTHDSMVAALLNAFDNFDGRAPPFGASIIFELYGNRPDEAYPSTQDNSYVRVGYLQDTDSRVISYLHLNGCEMVNGSESYCTLNQFLHYIKDFKMSLDQWNFECYNHLHNENGRIVCP